MRPAARLCILTLSFGLAMTDLTVTGRAEDSEETPITRADREHWAFAPLRRPPVPPSTVLQTLANSSDWARNPIDQFILSELTANELVPMPEAARTTLIRRLTFDLTGLPPTPEELDTFISDTRPDAYEQLVEKLLASSAYGERWAQHWLDLARFAETDGFEHDKLRPDAWKYRDWVIAALNDDLPYDQFVLAQLAGDEPPGHNRIATGFLTCGPDMPDINLQTERRHSFLNDMTSTVGAVFLGMQIGCAQCHDHKFDPISQLDFYRMRSFFDRAFTFTKNRTVELPQENSQDFQSFLMVRGDFRRPGSPVSPAFLRIANSQPIPIDLSAERSGQRTQLARWITRSENPLTTRVLANRLWHYHFGVGLSESPSDFGLAGDTPIHRNLLDWLATEISQRGWSLKEIHRLIVTSATWRQSSRLPEDASSELITQWRTSLTADSLNRLHSRGQRRRLEGEAIRDTMLAVSGQLNQRRSGPGIRPPLPPELVRSLLKNQWPVHPDPEEFYRRSIYLFVRRNLRYPLFEAFDKPDTNASCARRNSSTIAPQALMLMNSGLTIDTAKALAARLLAESGSDPAQQVERLFHLSLSRSPSAAESQIFEAALQTGASSGQASFNAQTALADLCLVMLNLNEFIYID
ncbi:MAG: DUF1549 and DUF1553 domain-containing protein [Planctomycetaceae bacterium]